jgi:glycosyltransferase involved in cell wall biosynthesis
MVMTPKTQVLFVNTKTQPPLGADTWVHVQIMRDLDRSTNDLTAACAFGTADLPTPTYRQLGSIRDLTVLPVDFGSERPVSSLAGKAGKLLGGMRAVRSLAKLALVVRNRQVQIIHTSDRPRDALACVLLARITGTKCLIHVHSTYGDWMRPVLKWSLRRADGLVAISDFVAQSLIDSGHDEDRVHIVLNGIDPSLWRAGEGREKIRQELGIPAGAPVVISVCRLYPGKGPEDLVRCLPALRAKHPDVVLVVVGEETIYGYRQHLQQVAQDLGVAESLKLVGFRNDIPDLMAAADVFAMASLAEPFGLVYLEAMAVQLPVVAFDSGATPEVVMDGTTGLLSDPGDSRQMTTNLLSLLGDPARRHQMGTAGRRRLEAGFTTARMAADVDALYKQLTSTTDAEAEDQLVTT